MPSSKLINLILCGGTVLSLVLLNCSSKQESANTFTNPLYRGQDPFVVRHSDGFYYYCESHNDSSIRIWKSDRLTDRGSSKIVWYPPVTGWNTSEVWAPELHFLQNKWYIYYAADSGDNKDHRSGVLESVTADAQGQYIDRGQLYTGDEYATKTNNRWAIDATPLEMNGKLFLLWSGWFGEDDDVQSLYIAPMANPYTVSGNRIRLANNDDFQWERVTCSHTGRRDREFDHRGLNEGPQILKNEGKIYLIYSCSGSWERNYKLGQLSLTEGKDPLEPANWTKKSLPAFSGSETVFAVGHASFTKSPDGTEDWIVYHSKIDTMLGWERDVRIQKFGWNEDGSPNFGTPLAVGVPLLLPAGEK